MQNPLEHEEAAFRVVLWALAYFAPIVVASWIATWLGFVVFLLATAAVVVLVRRSRRADRARAAAGAAETVPAAVADTRRIVVIANETLASTRLRDALVELADGVADDVLVLCPVPAASTAEEEDARERLERAVEELVHVGVHARGTLVRADPLQALEGELGSYGADEVVVSTFEHGSSAWLDAGVLDAIRARFDGPVTHVGEPPA